MEFSSWMEFFLENPHKPFQKRAFVPDSDSFRLVGKRPVSRWAMQTRRLPSLDPWACALGQLKWRCPHQFSTICQLHRVLSTILRGRDQGPYHLRRTLVLGDAKGLAQDPMAESGFEAHLLRVGLHMASVPTPLSGFLKGQGEPSGQGCHFQLGPVSASLAWLCACHSQNNPGGSGHGSLAITWDLFLCFG